VIATLGELLETGFRTAQAVCRCGHTETIDLAPLAVASGARAYWVDCRANLVCRGCGARGQIDATLDAPVAATGIEKVRQGSRS
jgi:hypothetical protein